MYERADHIGSAKNNKIMAKKIDLSVIDQQRATTMAANELKKQLDSRRAEVDRAVAKVLRERGLPKDFAGEIEYNGYTIRVQRRTVIQFMGD